MYRAAFDQDVDEVVWLINELRKHWPDISDEKLYKGTLSHALAVAISRRSEPVLRAILEAGCDVNSFDRVSKKNASLICNCTAHSLKT